MKWIFGSLALAVVGGAMLGFHPVTVNGTSPPASEVYGYYNGQPITELQVKRIIEEMTPYTGAEAARVAVESKLVRR